MFGDFFQMKFMMSQNEAFHAICPSLSIKMALGIGLFCNALLALGSERHEKIYKAALNGEVSNLKLIYNFHCLKTLLL